jgi:hypothetical protein
MGQEIGSVFPALGEMYARQAMMRAQTADLQNQQGGQQALGSYFQQLGQGAGGTPAPGQASVPAQIPGGTDHGYSAFRSAQQAVPSQLQGSRFAEVPSPTDVASGDSMNVSPDSRRRWSNAYWRGCFRCTATGGRPGRQAVPLARRHSARAGQGQPQGDLHADLSGCFRLYAVDEP